MGAGLYDAAFSTLGRLYGQQARTAIATLTLFGGLASTLCWPLSALLVSHVGWRAGCFIYAGIHLAIVLPIYLFLLPHEPKRNPATANAGDGVNKKLFKQSTTSGSALLFGLLAIAITLSAMISTVVSVHLLTILQKGGMTLAAAVGLGALVGPSQVAARTIEMVIARFHHPLWITFASVTFVAIGVSALWLGMPIVPLALAFYGAGIGLESIARGTLPLAMFGSNGYAKLMGRLAMPSLIAQAAAPSLGALLLEHFGAYDTLATLSGLALINVALACALGWLVFGRRRFQVQPR